MTTYSRQSEPTIWKDGRMVKERDLTASGTPPAVPASHPTDWMLFEGDESAGLELRWQGQIKYYRACARLLVDGEYSGEIGPIYSAEFEALDAADPLPVHAHDFINPIAEVARRNIASAVARSHMDPQKQAALSDMRATLKSLSSDLQRPYRAWQQAEERHQQRLESTADLRNQVSIMLEDIGERGVIPEYEKFVTQLRMLLKETKGVK